MLVQNSLKFDNVFLPGALGRIWDQNGMFALGTGVKQSSCGISQQLDFLDGIFRILVFVERVFVFFQICCGGQLNERTIGIQNDAYVFGKKVTSP